MPSIPFSVQFGSSGDYKLWASEGWMHDANDRQHTWAGHVAKHRFMMEYTKSDLQLEIDVIPLQARGVEQEIHVFVNGAFVAFWPIANPGVQSARIEAMFLERNDCLITFLMPKASCPRLLGLSQDERTLSVAFRSLSLTLAG
jgi:hypothetical protein